MKRKEHFIGRIVKTVAFMGLAAALAGVWHNAAGIQAAGKTYPVVVPVATRRLIYRTLMQQQHQHRRRHMVQANNISFLTLRQVVISIMWSLMKSKQVCKYC